MAVTTSFTPQQVIDAARRRHPALSTLVLDDVDLVDDYNQATRELVVLVAQVDKNILQQKTADLVVSGADGSFIDLGFPEGELAYPPKAIEAVQSATRVRVILRTEIEQRQQLIRELTDDGRPGGITLRNATNNRWELFEVTNWASVTAIAAFGVFFPVLVTLGTLTTAVLLPFILFGPLVEQFAFQIGHRADLGAEWFQVQQAEVAAKTKSALGAYQVDGSAT